MKIQDLKKKSYSELTEDEKKGLKKNKYINGCGGKGGMKVPSFFFTASCNHHDWNFTIGGGFGKYIKSNGYFYIAMYYDVNRKANLWILPLAQIFFIYYFIIATVYFIAVMINGVKYFNGDRKCIWWQIKKGIKRQINKVKKALKRLKK